MKRRAALVWIGLGLTALVVLIAVSLYWLSPARQVLAGSISCRECHQQFYELWSTSHHGLAMQPYSAEFARQNLTSHQTSIRIVANTYIPCIGENEGWILEKTPEGQLQHRIAHVMGGKNVYYFLTPMERGRLQTLPIAYDVRRKEWFDTAASGVRHFPGTQSDAPLHWTDPAYTFNTSCYSCHVSQLAKNFDVKTDTYRTTWAEPGINCEACHGPGQEHVDICQEAQANQAPKDLHIISTNSFSVEQTNAMCNSCHAKMSSISASFKPGDRFFDHFDLIALEHPDFYPDGRDLGENYTMTTWRMSPCVKAGSLDCTHCHTSSGRYRFKTAQNPNAACLPCHRERVENVTEHTHHDVNSPGNQCVACHMPMTEFARMTRSDHSMRPPAPAATLAFKSPNACNLCHEDKDTNWANDHVRKWHEKDYQRPLLEQANLVDEARRGNWDRLETILTYIRSENRDEIATASLLRLLVNCESQAKWPAVIQVLQEDSSPLVRAAAAQTLDGYVTAESIRALAKATSDEYRLVRVRAATALAGINIERLPSEYQMSANHATTELLEAFGAHPDDYASHFNLGNFHVRRHDEKKALASYETAIKLRPDFVPPYVNIAFIHNAIGRNDKAEASFRKAIALDPNNAAVHLNLGMLLAEMKRPKEAEKAFRSALTADPNCAAAAYNLGVLLASDQPSESLQWCRKAYLLHPEEGRYGYTYAFYLYQKGNVEQARIVLVEMMNRNVPYSDAYALLATIYLQRGEPNKATEVYASACNNMNLSQQERDAFKAAMWKLKQGL
ncbi:MAG: tetratricopeptide repeat protein [Sedimentisphaerales bacterium]|nr:tetratricopeptide repeat protein [Sedimentisphaerales bacterium]